MKNINTDSRFTDGRVPDSSIRALLTDEHRWQCWLAVEVALAFAEAEVGIVPKAAAEQIAAHAQIDKLDVDRIHDGILKTSHPLMALISELSNKVGDPHGGWVHWGATTQNITQTGDALLLKEMHHVFLRLIGKTLSAMEVLALKGQNMVCAGRTHGQQAVPITFGFKVASWIDEFSRHVERLHQVEPRVFTVMIGGAVGNYASLGEKGPEIELKMAETLGLKPMAIPSRAMSDFLAEYVCILGMIAGTTSRIAKEVYILMQSEFDEVSEPIPAGVTGSSTMPQKRNPQLADDCIALSAQIRSLVPLALEGMLHDHEVSGADSSITDSAILRSCVLTGDMLTRLVVILSGLNLHPNQMRANLDITGGLIMSEAIMLSLGESIGRQHAHEIVYNAAQAAAVSGQSFRDELCANSLITDHLNSDQLDKLLNPESYIGLSSRLSKEAARRAHSLSERLQKQTVYSIDCTSNAFIKNSKKMIRRKSGFLHKLTREI